MKKIYFNILGVILLLSIGACKKYGYKIDDGYSKPSTEEASSLKPDTSMSYVDRSLYPRARIFPGLVDVAEPRVKDEKFTLDLNFSASNQSLLRISVSPQPLYSTGYYAAPGELVKIIVPQGINGLTVQVGGHTDNLTGKLTLQRDPLITMVKQLSPGVNYVRNPYGGTIYIQPAFAIPQPVEFTITGAVKSPDFVLGVSNDATWKAQVLASFVPWLEFRSNRVIFLVPRDMVVEAINKGVLTRPTDLMSTWNTIFELDFNGWMGLSDNSPDVRDRSPQGPWREVLDIQPSAGSGHNGFPTVATMDEGWFNDIINLDALLHGENWGTYHEFGHNCQQGNIWSWSVLGETTNNLFSFKVANRNGAGIEIQHEGKWIQPALDFARLNNFTNNFETAAAMDDPFRRMVPFLQIFGIYGYDAMPYIYKAARRAPRFSVTDQDKRDFTYEAFSNYARVDLKPFFDAWGMQVSTQSKAKIAALYPLLTKQIWTYNPDTKTGGTADIVFKLTVSVNSEETGGEGPVSGYATAMIDGSNTTFWHSKWSTSPTGTFPYNIVLDAGTAVVAKGLYFVPRSSGGQRPKVAEIYTSTDGVNWTIVGTTTITNSASRYNYNFPTNKTVQYFKVKLIGPNWSGTQTAALAELGIIK